MQNRYRNQWVGYSSFRSRRTSPKLPRTWHGMASSRRVRRVAAKAYFPGGVRRVGSGGGNRERTARGRLSRRLDAPTPRCNVHRLPLRPQNTLRTYESLVSGRSTDEINFVRQSPSPQFPLPRRCSFDIAVQDPAHEMSLAPLRFRDCTRAGHDNPCRQIWFQTHI